MLSAANVTMQFGAKPLFENISVKFGGGNRYGLIGANGCGKSTLMKILGGDLEAYGGNVALDPGERLGKLRQDQFAYEDQRVLDVVLMGHAELWADEGRARRDLRQPRCDRGRLRARGQPRGALRGTRRLHLGGPRSELLQGLGIALPLHEGPMSAVAPGWKLRVLLAQALFADPEVLLLDEPTNHLDINTIRWLEGVLNARDSTMVIISHDRHFLNSVCTHMADLDYGTLRVYPGDYDDYMIAATHGARTGAVVQRARPRTASRSCRNSCAGSRPTRRGRSRPRRAGSRSRRLQPDDVKPSSRQNPYIRFEFDPKQKLHRHAVEVEHIAKTWPGSPIRCSTDLSFLLEAGQRLAIVGPNGVRQDHAAAHAAGRPHARCRHGQMGRARGDRATTRRTRPPISPRMTTCSTGWRHGSSPPTTSRSCAPRWAGCCSPATRPSKSVTVLSGGERGRMLFGKLMLQQPNVLVMDEPTNHMDMESIESLQLALEKYAGTLILVSHDRQFVSALATQVIELGGERPVHFDGPYEEYLASRGFVLKSGAGRYRRVFAHIWRVLSPFVQLYLRGGRKRSKICHWDSDARPSRLT